MFERTDQLEKFIAGCPNGCTLIISGGDGSVSLLIDTVMHVKPDGGLTVKILPGGTGNDFYKCFVADAEPKKADIVEATMLSTGSKRFFANCAEVGFGGEVVARSEKFRPLTRIARMMSLFLVGPEPSKPSFGDLSYSLGTIESGFLSQVRSELLIMNGKYAGGGTVYFPWSDPCDGNFDVMKVSRIQLAELLRNLRNLRSGVKISSGEIEYFSSSELTVEEPGLTVQADGDLIGSSPVRFRILKNALSIVTGVKGCPRKK